MNLTLDMRALLDQIHKCPEDDTLRLVVADKACEDGLASLESLLRLIVPPFLPTGSRTYGNPTEESDWDWVWLDNQSGFAGARKLHMLADTSTWDSFAATDWSKDPYWKCPGISAAMRFGPVNLIVCTYRGQYEAWIKGTQRLVAMCDQYVRPTRDTAVEVFQEEFAKISPF